jgi:hypothetical protein
MFFMNNPEKPVSEAGSEAEPERIPLEGYIKYTLFGPKRYLEGMSKTDIDAMLLVGAQLINGASRIPTEAILENVEMVVTKYLEP